MVVAWKNNGSFDCPHCGATLQADAKMCRACGADASCGWSEDSYTEEYEPEDEFDYDSFVAREFPDQATSSPPSSQNLMRLVMLLVIISILLAMVV